MRVVSRPFSNGHMKMGSGGAGHRDLKSNPAIIKILRLDFSKAIIAVIFMIALISMAAVKSTCDIIYTGVAVGIIATITTLVDAVFIMRTVNFQWR